MNFEFPNLFIQIFKFFAHVDDSQRMPLRFLFIVYYDTHYTSFMG
jgi:hypothetical protein